MDDLGPRDLETQDLLHYPNEDGGLGFCGRMMTSMLPVDYHGPLIVALDSSILIDLQEHGTDLCNGECRIHERKYRSDLEYLGQLLDLWLLRDIRFIATPRARTDAKKITSRFNTRREATMRALNEGLAYQIGIWNCEVQPIWSDLKPYEHIQGLPDNADRDLVAEAVAVGAHVFLTRDDRLITNVRVVGRSLLTCSPSTLVAELESYGVALLDGGSCSSPECPYKKRPLLFPDIGKWEMLSSIFD